MQYRDLVMEIGHDVILWVILVGIAQHPDDAILCFDCAIQWVMLVGTLYSWDLNENNENENTKLWKLKRPPSGRGLINACKQRFVCKHRFVCKQNAKWNLHSQSVTNLQHSQAFSGWSNVRRQHHSQLTNLWPVYDASKVHYTIKS